MHSLQHHVSLCYSTQSLYRYEDVRENNTVRIIHHCICQHFLDNIHLMNYAEAKKLFTEDKDSYGKPRAIITKLKKIYAEFEAEKKKKPEKLVMTEHTTVCSECGGPNIQIKVWVDANTQEYKSDTEGDTSDQWCEDCESHNSFMTRQEWVDEQSDLDKFVNK